ncbi:hypothetical protein V490_05146 [Pseudogymnoascus sp. VKM F-3557]|nr:hypothetical protein V490_05146 [Pseudogymnoascus sp. VKM F-3557]
MPRPSSSLLLALLGSVSSAIGCTIPPGTLPNSIADKFSIVVQNPKIPTVHNKIMNFRANGDDEHLVLRPAGVVTNDVLYLENGRLITRNIHAVIDLEYNDQDNTTKMFMTERDEPAALFTPEYFCDPDTDKLQIRLKLASRETVPPVKGGQIGIRLAVDTYEFRYSPPNNPKINDEFMPIDMVIFRDGISPTGTATPPTSTTKPPGTTTIPTSTKAPTGTPTFPAEVGNYDFVYCLAEPADGRALTSANTAADDMTLEKCAAFCAAYPYFGTEWSRECFCGNEPVQGSNLAPLTECNYACSGDPTQACGGSRRLSLYNNPNLTGPQQPANFAGRFA